MLILKMNKNNIKRKKYEPISLTNIDEKTLHEILTNPILYLKNIHHD